MQNVEYMNQNDDVDGKNIIKSQANERKWDRERKEQREAKTNRASTPECII